MTNGEIRHLAIFNPPFLDLILEGKKTVEGRFSKVRCAPFGVIKPGDLVFMKESGGLVKGSFVVLRVDSFSGLTPNDMKKIELQYKTSLSAEADPDYWNKRCESRYATLLHVSRPIQFETPFSFPKRDRRGWVVLDRFNISSNSQLSLSID